MKFEAVLFDMDGVLINSEPHYWKEEREFYTALGAPLTDEQLSAMMGASPAANTGRLLSWYPNLGYTHEELIPIHEQVLLHGIMRVESLADGVETWLHRIRADGMKLSVASSAPVLLVDYARQHFHFDELFDAQICCRDVKNAKPAPDIFLEAARRVGVPPEKCLVVEDSQNGVLAARAAGIPVAAYTGALMGPAAKGADWTFPRYDDLWYDVIFNMN